MKIVLLTRDNNLYSCKRLLESAKKRGHHLKMIDPILCYTVINKYKFPTLYYINKKINYFDAVISRINPNNICGMSILKYFEINSSYILNSFESIIKAKNKFLSMQLLSNKGISVPITIFSNSFNDISNTIEIVGEPLVIKLIDGKQGIGVILANTKKSAISIIETFYSMNTNILLQEYIQDSKGYDIRCFVIGNKVVGSIKRQAKKEDFRSNLHRGGIAKKVNISNIEKNIAIQATSILGLNLAGVDIIRSNRGPLVIEVNSSPGIEGIEKTLEIDIADLIIKFIEDKVFNKIM